MHIKLHLYHLELVIASFAFICLYKANSCNRNISMRDISSMVILIVLVKLLFYYLTRLFSIASFKA